MLTVTRRRGMIGDVEIIVYNGSSLRSWYQYKKGNGGTNEVERRQ